MHFPHDYVMFRARHSLSMKGLQIRHQFDSRRYVTRDVLLQLSAGALSELIPLSLEDAARNEAVCTQREGAVLLWQRNAFG